MGITEVIHGYSITLAERDNLTVKSLPGYKSHVCRFCPDLDSVSVVNVLVILNAFARSQNLLDAVPVASARA